MSPYRRRRVEIRKPATPMMWLAFITLTAALVAFILGWGGGAIDFIEHCFSIGTTLIGPTISTGPIIMDYPAQKRATQAAEMITENHQQQGQIDAPSRAKVSGRSRGKWWGKG